MPTWIHEPTRRTVQEIVSVQIHCGVYRFKLSAGPSHWQMYMQVRLLSG